MTAEHLYSGEGDLLTGDLIFAGDLPTRMIHSAADEIDAALGSLYVTPVISTERHETLLLKQISNLIATGRLIMSAATDETSERHSYGLGLLREGQQLLAQISTMQVILYGAAGTGSVARTNAPTISGQDTTSAVDFFYGSVMGGEVPMTPWVPGVTA